LWKNKKDFVNFFFFVLRKKELQTPAIHQPTEDFLPDLKPVHNKKKCKCRLTSENAAPFPPLDDRPCPLFLFLELGLFSKA